jgi:glycosyltransferase involved in cell wall biosynthesis
LRVIEKKNLRFADVIIAANIERATIMKKYFSLKNLPIVFDNIHKIEDAYDESLCNEKYSHLFTDKDFFAVYGGGVNKTRFTYELAEAFHRLGEGYRLLVFGAATEKEKSDFREYISSKKITNVLYLGMLPRNEWRYFLSKAKISISAFLQDTPNNIFCASGKLYEGLFEGTPVLTSANPPFQRICNTYGVGVSTNDFYVGVLELQKNYEQYLQKVNSYILTIEIGNRITDLYHSIMEKMSEIAA